METNRSHDPEPKDRQTTNVPADLAAATSGKASYVQQTFLFEEPCSFTNCPCNCGGRCSIETGDPCRTKRGIYSRRSLHPLPH